MPVLTVTINKRIEVFIEPYAFGFKAEPGDDVLLDYIDDPVQPITVEIDEGIIVLHAWEPIVTRNGKVILDMRQPESMK